MTAPAEVKSPEAILDKAYLNILRAACRGDQLSMDAARSICWAVETVTGERARLLSRKANIVGACRREFNHYSS